MYSLLRSAFMVSFVPGPKGFQLGTTDTTSDNVPNGHPTDNPQGLSSVSHQHVTDWYEEELEEDLRWSFSLNNNGILHAGRSEFQNLTLLDTKRFGKVLVIDGKLQSAEMDEFIYHESLVHPALLIHYNPKTVFIMGGGEGSTAREALKHKGIEKVVMCDIDSEVVDFCKKYLTENQEAFNDKRLVIVINDALVELQKAEEKFDVIVGDLADPLEGGPCNKLYTKSFYEQIVKPKLNDNGIFVTQAGPAGMLSHKDVFAPIYNTLKHVFNNVVAYIAHIPSYADSAGWVLASDQPIQVNAELLNSRINERIRGELRYLDGEFIAASTVLNKTIRASLQNESHVFTDENVRFIHGHGIAGDA
ncbi:Thermospermine synthase [Quillaja saponaria]|uniref:thermospermine synthase n=1 Tax=Quillaja saponaria TaxID=32244 RepID=A0AAD7QDJ9_QUISA|nr:Thermospermine synthase [Quillaja saponaria]